MLKFLKKLFTIRAVCPVCGDTFSTMKGVKIHIGNSKDKLHREYKLNQMKRELNG